MIELQDALDWWSGEEEMSTCDRRHLRRLKDAARRVANGIPIQWCQTHGSVDVDSYCESFHADAESGRWSRDRYDDVIAERFGKCHIVSHLLVDAAVTPPGDPDPPEET